MKVIKNVIALFLIILIGTYSLVFAVVVTDNDGAAFITKAEFDSLKNSFQSQIDSYNANIDNKIDNAIASYLAGISVSKTSVVSTTFVLEGDENKIVFVGRRKDFNDMSKDLYTSDRIFEIFCGTYQTDAYWIQDTYDTFCFEATHTKGSTVNYLYILDTNNYALSSKKGVQMNASRIYVVYSTYHAGNGMWWGGITQTLNVPNTITSTSSAFINSTTAKGYGLRRQNVQSDIYNVELTHKLYSANGNPNGVPSPQVLKRTPLETKKLTEVTKTCDVAFVGTDAGTNYHFPQGSIYNIKTINKDWGSSELIRAYQNSRFDYSYVYKLRNSGGYAASEVPGSFTPQVSGYGLDWPVISYTFSNIFYNNINSSWKEKLSYSGGLPLCPKTKKGEFEITFSVDKEVKISFSNAQNESFPNTGNPRFKKCKLKVHGTSDDFVEMDSSIILTAGTYDFKVELTDEPLFLMAYMDSRTDTVTFTQVGDAKLTEKNN